jgi:CubicO group peptidase (beta-lactamase class C family)
MLGCKLVWILLGGSSARSLARKGEHVKKAIPCVFLMLLSLAPLGLGTDEPHGRRRATTPFEARVDAYLRPYEEMKCFSGTVIVARKGRVLLRKGYGMANYELNVPNTAHTKFQIASLSKAFTAAAIMILQARGRLSATDPLSRFAPIILEEMR